MGKGQLFSVRLEEQTEQLVDQYPGATPAS